MKNKFYTFKMNKLEDKEYQLYNIVNCCRNYIIVKLSNKFQKQNWYVEDVFNVECLNLFEEYGELYCTVEFSGYDKLEELAATTGKPIMFRNTKKIPLYIKLGREFEILDYINNIKEGDLR